VAALGRKQTIADPTPWREAIAQARTLVPDHELDRLISQTLDAIAAERAAGARIGYAWSGGKDSQVMRWLMEQAGIKDAVLGMTVGLEWPAMLRWLTDHLPAGCDVHAEPLDLAWLAAHPAMLFPQGANGTRWFALVQHRAQRRYSRSNGLDLLALGRRRKDGNYVGAAGADRYTDSHGVTRWSPIAGWSHEQVFALLGREAIPLPPCYDWPRGYQVGTGPWPARQWTTSHDHGFAECWAIDAAHIRAVAADFAPAAAWMDRAGVS